MAEPERQPAPSPKAQPQQSQERRRGGEGMLRHKILIVSGEPSMRRSLKRLMTATGAVTEFVSDLKKLPADPPSLICVDLRSKGGPGIDEIHKVYPDKRLVCVVGVQDYKQIIGCLKNPRCGSVITYDDHFEPEDFIITVTKLLHGQIFGLQKYFPWGVTLYNMDITSYDDKTKALDVLMAYAELAGARGPVRDRIGLVAEELLMNAMYHAPVDDKGNEIYKSTPRRELSKITLPRSVKLACASNGQHFAIAVRDHYGSLEKDTVVKFLAKGEADYLEPEQRDSGAGLGLVTTLKSASKLVFNLAPGVGTEVIALFHLDLIQAGHKGVRSVHVFTDRRKPAPVEVPPEPPQKAPLAPLVAGALAVVLIIFGIVGVVRRLNEPPPASVKAEVKVDDGQTQEVPVRVGSRDLKLKLSRNGSNVVITSE